MRTRLVSTATVAALAMVIGLLTAGSAVATQPQSIHVKEVVGNQTYIHVGQFAQCTNRITCQGDYFVSYNRLVDAGSGADVGTLAAECFVLNTGANLFHCPGNTVTLSGRGQIVFAETVDFSAPTGMRGPITGGTGEFLGVTGYVTSGGREDFVIVITGS